MRRVYHFGDYLLQAERRALLHRAAPVPVPARAFDILLFLIEQRHRVVEKDEILERVWPGLSVEEGNLSQQVFVLRRLLDNPGYIRTVPRRGYQFVAPVSEEVLPGALSELAPALALHLELTLDPPLVLGPVPALALAADARLLVYVGVRAGTTGLFVRRLDAYASRFIEGSEDAAAPFLSPDARWVGFSARGRLHRVGIDGGRPITLCDVEGAGRGAAWGDDHLIVFAPHPAGALYVVSAAGGTPRALTRLAFEDGERSHRFPRFVGGGRSVLFTISRAGDASFDDARLALTDLVAEPGRVPAHRVILEQASCGFVSGDTRLYYRRAGTLFVSTFEPSSGTCATVGEPVDAVAVHDAGAVHAAAAAGLLIAAPPLMPIAPTRLVWRQGDGPDRELPGLSGIPEEPRIAPDGRHVVVGVRAERSDLWVIDLERGTTSRLTEAGDNFAAVWMPDGRRVVFSSNRDGASNLYCLDIGGPDAAERVTRSDAEQVAGAWTPDGALVFTEYDARTGASLWIRESDGAVRPLGHSRYNEYAPALSPSGNWLAYTSDASGLAEVYLVAFPGMTDRQQISTGGGSEPVWIPGTRRLCYRAGNALCRVEIDDRGRISHGDTVPTDGSVPGTLTGSANYDVHPDGRLLMVALPIVEQTRAVVRAVVTCASAPR